MTGRPRVLAAVLLAFLSGCAQAIHQAPAELPLRVLVFNIHAGKDAVGARNLERVAEVVRTTGADLVLLQEVDRKTERSGREDQLAILERLTGFHGAFGRTLHYQGGEYGIAVLARWPIEADSLHPLRVSPLTGSAGEAPEARGALHAIVRTPGGPVHVVSTHLDASRDGYYRLQQVEGVHDLAQMLRSRGGWVLVGGDFNATPESPTIARMTTGGWQDAWIGCGTGPGASIPVQLPRSRIDYLFLPPPVSCESAEVVETLASDHRPVVFTIKVR